MQEKEKAVFVIATANDHTAIPPEFMRAGRFDEVFFVDLPSYSERKAIFEVLLKQRKRNPKNFDIDKMAAISEHYSGAEIRKAIDSALFKGYGEGKREITTNDIHLAISSFQPLFKMKSEDFENIREWAKGRAVIANSDDESPTIADKKISLDI
jgi:SpoVK/Ycf46/Vps4 family AAA+-type ATPase